MTNPLQHQIAQLQQAIAALQQAISGLSALPDVQHQLQAQLAEKQRQLAALTGQTTPPGSTVINQSGGVSLGSGTTIGQIGDIVGGDKIMGDKVGGNKYTVGDISGSTVAIGDQAQAGTVYGPTILGPITSGRDVHVGTNQTINNYENRPPQASAQPQLGTAGSAPALQILLEDSHGRPLTALTPGQEARLKLDLVGEVATLPSLDLQLEADGSVSWPDGTQRTVQLRPTVSPALPRWSLVARAVGPVTLTVLVFAAGRLIQRLGLTTSVTSGASGLLSTPAVPLVSSPALRIDPQLSTLAAVQSQPDSLTLILDEERTGHRLTLIDGRRWTCMLPHTRDDLADIVAAARHTILTDVVDKMFDGVPRFQTGVTIPEHVLAAGLTGLGRLGTTLWQRLFHPTGGGRDIEELAAHLRRRSRQSTLEITVLADRLAFPWQLLYDQELTDQVSIDSFWGFRHTITTLPASARGGITGGDLGLPADLTALVAYNLGLDSEAHHPVIEEQRKAFTELNINARELTDEGALRDALAQGSDAQILYLFCHALNVQPHASPLVGGERVPIGIGSTRLILTTPEQALTLDALRTAAGLERAPLLRGGPLVILNACGSAALSPLTSDGLAPYLLDLGARAVIGTECDTPILAGAAFGSAVLTALVRDRFPIGAALRAARRQLFQEHQNPLGLLYALYGNAALGLSGTSEERSPV